MPDLWIAEEGKRVPVVATVPARGAPLTEADGLDPGFLQGEEAGVDEVADVGLREVLAPILEGHPGRERERERERGGGKRDRETEKERERVRQRRRETKREGERETEREREER